MRAAHYAEALYSAITDHPNDEEKLVGNFVATLKTNGHTHFLPRIIRSIERYHARDEKSRTISITSSKVLSEQDTQEILRKEPFKNLLSASHKRVERIVDDSVIGGVIVRTKTVRVDASYKRALIELYQSLIRS